MTLKQWKNAFVILANIFFLGTVFTSNIKIHPIKNGDKIKDKICGKGLRKE